MFFYSNRKLNLNYIRKINRYLNKEIKLKFKIFYKNILNKIILYLSCFGKKFLKHFFWHFHEFFFRLFAPFFYLTIVFNDLEVCSFDLIFLSLFFFKLSFLFKPLFSLVPHVFYGFIKSSKFLSFLSLFL